MVSDFEKQSYWRQRFSHETSFEWLLSSAHFVRLMRPQLATLSPSARILQLGCGTSDLQNHLRGSGFDQVTNVDYEPLALERGRQLERQEFGDVKTKYAIADATQLMDQAGIEEYGMVVDKGTADAVACAGDQALLRMARGVKSRLQRGAVWISLSFSSSRFDLAEIPFHVEVLDRVPVRKLKETDPDVFHWCFLLRPR